MEVHKGSNGTMREWSGNGRLNHKTNTPVQPAGTLCNTQVLVSWLCAKCSRYVDINLLVGCENCGFFLGIKLACVSALLGHSKVTACNIQNSADIYITEYCSPSDHLIRSNEQIWVGQTTCSLLWRVVPGPHVYALTLFFSTIIALSMQINNHKTETITLLGYSGKV